MIKVLGLDPGFINCGYTITDMKIYNGRLAHRPLETGILKNPIQNFNNLKSAVSAFEYEIKSMLTGVDLVVVERFVGRQFTPKGKNPEAISFMVACACSVAARMGVHTTLLTAAQWKNAWHKDKERAVLKVVYSNFRAPAHLVDGFLQASYGGALYLGVQPYLGLDNKLMTKHLRQLERLPHGLDLRKIRASGKL